MAKKPTIDPNNIRATMLNYALTSMIDAFTDVYKDVLRAKVAQETARIKAEEQQKIIRAQMEADKAKIKFGKLEFSTTALGKNAKFVVPVISAVGVAISATTFLLKNLDQARRVSGEIRRWNERLDKRKLEAEKRRQEEWQIKKGKMSPEGTTQQVKRRRGRPRKGG